MVWVNCSATFPTSGRKIPSPWPTTIFIEDRYTFGWAYVYAPAAPTVTSVTSATNHHLRRRMERYSARVRVGSLELCIRLNGNTGLPRNHRHSGPFMVPSSPAIGLGRFPLRVAHRDHGRKGQAEPDDEPKRAC